MLTEILKDVAKASVRNLGSPAKVSKRRYSENYPIDRLEITEKNSDESKVKRFLVAELIEKSLFK